MAGGEAIGVGMLGYAFMGKAHSRAFRGRPTLDIRRSGPSWSRISGPRRGEGRGGAARLRLGRGDRPTGASRSPTTASASSTTAGRTRSTPSRRIEAARDGKHVLCEKPLGRTADESHGDVARGRRAGVVHMCGFNYRFVPAVRLARELLEAGDLGELFHFRARYLQSWGVDAPPSWRFDSRARGLGRPRRPRRPHRRPRPLPRRRADLAINAVTKHLRRGTRRWTTRSRRRSSSQTAPSGRSRHPRLATGRHQPQHLRGERLARRRSPSTSSG